ncbi:MAG: DsbA family protein [Sandaracinus sp.]|nr:DsbA family protein [Sandaracinus sp.]
MSGHVECFFDYSSPFAYLGTTQIERVAHEEGATFAWRPFLLGALFRSIGTPDVPIATFSEAKRRAQLLDLHRWSRVHGVGFRFPSRFPLRSVDALRLTYVVPEAERSALIARVMRAAWVDDEGLERDVLARCLVDVGLDEALRDARRRAGDQSRASCDDGRGRAPWCAGCADVLRHGRRSRIGGVGPGPARVRAAGAARPARSLNDAARFPIDSRGFTRAV